MVHLRASNQCIAHELLHNVAKGQQPVAVVQNIRDRRMRSSMRSILNRLDMMSEDQMHFTCRNGVQMKKHTPEQELAGQLDQILTDSHHLQQF